MSEVWGACFREGFVLWEGGGVGLINGMLWYSQIFIEIYLH